MVLDRKSDEWKGLTKIGRTHFQDAVPISLGQEVSAWSKQLKDAEDALVMSLDELSFLPLGGTAVGTGINCPNDFSEESIKSCLLYTSPSPRDRQKSRMPSSA